MAQPAHEAWAVHLPAGVRRADVDLLEARSLPAAWVRRWAAEPGRPALHGAEGWLTADELEGRTRVVATRLHGAGLRSGDRVVMSAEASVALAVAHVAVLRLGLVAVPVNTGYREREVAHIVRDAAPRAVIVDDAERGRWMSDAIDGGTLVLGPDVELPSGAAPPLDPPALDTAAPDDLAMLCYTSGTTGAPKGAMLTHGNLLAGAEAVRLAWHWSAADRLVLALPLFHMHGLGVGLHGTLLAGASAVVLPSFDVDVVLDAVGEQTASLFFGVPTMYARLARSSRAGELAALRLCVSGSAPLPADLHARLAEVAGQSVLERYGMTETLMNVSNPYDGERRAGTVGFPLPGVELALADGGSGEVSVRGPNVFPGYWHRQAETASAFGPDGWFRTGDVGEIDADGYLRLVGRTKELIITGGLNVYPREVEDVLRGHPGVADVAVVGAPSEEWGEMVTAVVVPNGAPDPDRLLAWAAGQLAPFKRPRAVRYVEELPRNALGKVLRHEL